MKLKCATARIKAARLKGGDSDACPAVSASLNFSAAALFRAQNDRASRMGAASCPLARKPSRTRPIHNTRRPVPHAALRLLVHPTAQLDPHPACGRARRLRGRPMSSWASLEPRQRTLQTRRTRFPTKLPIISLPFTRGMGLERSIASVMSEKCASAIAFGARKQLLPAKWVRGGYHRMLASQRALTRLSAIAAALYVTIPKKQYVEEVESSGEIPDVKPRRPAPSPRGLKEAGKGDFAGK